MSNLSIYQPKTIPSGTPAGNPYQKNSAYYSKGQSPYLQGTYGHFRQLPPKPELKYKHQISDEDFMNYLPVLTRIKKANEFITRYADRDDLVESAKEKFQKEIVPEALAVGIDESFSWALFLFGENFLRYEFQDRKTVDQISF